jgi:hypothetical protein
VNAGMSVACSGEQGRRIIFDATVVAKHPHTNVSGLGESLEAVVVIVDP